MKLTELKKAIEKSGCMLITRDFFRQIVKEKEEYKEENKILRQKLKQNDR